MKYAVVVLAALVLVLGSHGVTRGEAPAGVQKWEYKVVEYKRVMQEGAKLNELGREGWELVALTDGMTFKRPVE